MRLIHCKKCGSAMVTEDALVERMNDTINILYDKARHAKNSKESKLYQEQAKSITSMMKGIIHNTAQITDRKTTCQCELSEITHYILANKLVSEEKLGELRKIAREKARIRNEENQKAIDRIYKNYNTLYTPSNKTKADPTARRAIAKTKP